MYLETQRLIIRDFTVDDAKDLHEILGDEETMKNCEPAYDFAKTKKFLEDFCRDNRCCKICWFDEKIGNDTRGNSAKPDKRQ